MSKAAVVRNYYQEMLFMTQGHMYIYIYIYIYINIIHIVNLDLFVQVALASGSMALEEGPAGHSLAF